MQLFFGVKRVILEPGVFNRVVDIVSVLNLLSVRFLLVFTGAFTFAACSSNAIRILYDSEPQGAMITAVDSIAALGRAPVVKAYNLDTLPAPDENGCIIIPGVEALWDSGATARIGGVENLRSRAKRLFDSATASYRLSGPGCRSGSGTRAGSEVIY